VCLAVRLCVTCLRVRALERKLLEISTSKSLETYSPQHALTHRSKGQMTRSRGHQNAKCVCVSMGLYVDPTAHRYSYKLTEPMLTSPAALTRFVRSNVSVCLWVCGTRISHKNHARTTRLHQVVYVHCKK